MGRDQVSRGASSGGIGAVVDWVAGDVVLAGVAAGDAAVEVVPDSAALLSAY